MTEPQPITEAPAPSDVPDRPTSTGAVQIYLVRPGRLGAVDRVGRTARMRCRCSPPAPRRSATRPGSSPSCASAIRRAERRDPDVLTVEIDSGVTALPADRQRLAVAQIVWTATGVCCDAPGAPRRRRPPRCGGDGRRLGRRTGRRDDYRSVAPA